MPSLTKDKKILAAKITRKILILGVFSFATILAILGFGLAKAHAATGINTQLNYQGKLNTSVGNAVADSSWNFRFRIYDASSGGNLLWTERWTATSTQVTTVNGVFSVSLGSISSLSGVDFNNNSLYLQVDLDADTNGSWEETFSTRKRLTATPYAFNADLIDGIHATSTAAVANQLLALDSYGNLNLFNQGVSSTYATTTWLYVRSDATINTLNATTTNVDNLTVFKTGTFNWLSATTSLDYWFNASSTLASGLSQWYYPWAGTIAPTSSVGIFINASSTINADFRVAGNATTTGHFEADSTLYVKDSKVGVGTSTPAFPLTVGGTSYFYTSSTNSKINSNFVNISAATYDINRLTIDAGTTASADIYFRGGVAGKAHSILSGTNLNIIAVSGQINFGKGITYAGVGDETITSPYMTIIDGGNVGIGTTAPAALLHVAGTTLLAGNASTTGTLVVNGQTGTSAWVAPTNTLTVVGSGLFTGNATTSGNFTVGTSTLIVQHDPEGTGNNKVGIGTMNPYDELQIVGSLALGRHSSDQKYRYVFDAKSSLNNVLSIGYQTALDTWFTGNPSLNLTYTGQIGIGLTSPTSTLSVLGTADIRGNATTTGNLVVGTGTTVGWGIPTNTLTVVGSGLFTGNVRLNGNATTSGYFVVGMTNPTVNLDVGDLLVGDDATITDTLVVGTTARTATGTVLYGGMIVDATTLVVNANNDRVGIGTASPDSKLHIRQAMTASAVNDIIVMTNAGAGDAAVARIAGRSYPDTDQTAIDFIQNSLSTFRSEIAFSTYTGGALSEAMRIDWAQRVGIGLTTPTSTLSVAGTADIRGNATTTGNLVVGTGTTVGWGIPTNTLTVVGSGLFTGNATTSGHFSASEIGLNGVYRTTWPTSGSGANDWKVLPWAVQALTPTSTNNLTGLFVNASSTIAANFRVDGNATTTGSLHIGSSSLRLESGVIWQSTGTLTLTAKAADLNLTSVTDGFNFTLGGGAGDDFIVDSTTLVVESDNNNVGIGTASPVTKLHVYGTDNKIALFGNSTTFLNDNHQVEIVGTGTRTPLVIMAGSGQVEFWKDTTPTTAIAFGMGTPGVAITDDFVVSTYDTSALWLERLRILTSNGYVGIGDPTPSYQLELSTDSAAKPTSALWTIPSDERTKTNIQDFNDGLDIIMQINPVTYEYNGKGGFVEDGSMKVGIIAQKLQPVAPYMIGTYISKLNEDDEEETELLNYQGHALAFITVNAIQELKTELDAISSQLLNNQTSTSSPTSTKAILLSQKNQLDSLDSRLRVLENNTNTQPVVNQPLIVVDNPDLNIQTLVVQQAATFYGTLYVQGEAGFMHKVVFEEDIEVKGKIYASADQAGTATIKAGATSTEVVFNSEYEVAPKIAVSIKGDTLLLHGIKDVTNKSFKIHIVEPVDQPLAFDWIALAVKGTGEPPVINNFITSLDTVGLDIPVELWAQVTDPDTQENDLTYTWSFEPNLGNLDGNTGLVYWTVNNGVSQDTDVTVTVTVTDGSHSVSESKVVKVLAPPKEDNPIVRGCTDQTALNYNSEATEDDGLCQYEIVQTPTSTEPLITLGCTDQLALNYDSGANQDDWSCAYYSSPVVQEVTSTTTEPVAQGDGNEGVGGGEL